jgi:hypothetical protein
MARHWLAAVGQITARLENCDGDDELWQSGHHLQIFCKAQGVALVDG